MTILFGTGHRPEDCEPELEMRRKIERALEGIQPEVCINGLAAGFDLWFAAEALLHNIEVWSVKPWKGHRPRKGDERLYAAVIEQSSRVIILDPSEDYPGPWVYHNRNQWMVDNANEGLAYWNGKESGGTYGCLQYAKKQGKEWTNCYDYILA